MKTRLYSLALVFAFSLTALAPAWAAPASDPGLSVADETRVQHQMLRLLQSEQTAAQGRALQLILEFKRADVFSSDFYRPLTPRIGALALHSDSEALQLMAVSALYTLRLPTAIAQLQQAVQQLPDGHVHDVATRALRQHRLDEAEKERDAFVERVLWGRW